MKRTITTCLSLLAGVLTASAQFPVKFDSQYKKIFAKDLCKLAKEDPNLLLIDVRSPGEYSDTSQYASLNIGHLKSAINIPVDSIQKDISVLNPYKNKTLVFYCSHSQRSRRVSKLAAENGFTNFYNLNGGMSFLNEMTAEEFPCKKEWLQTNLKYTNLSSSEAITLIKQQKDLVIIDVRPEPIFSSTDSLVQNNIGHLKGAINIPYKGKEITLADYQQYKGKTILVCTQSGDGNAARTASFLVKNGFANVYHMVSGLNELLLLKDGKQLLENLPVYQWTDGRGVLNLLRTKKQAVIYDTRPKEEFENKLTGRDSFRNLGKLKNSVNITENDFDTYQYPADKNADILICGHEEAVKLADKLAKKGYKQVHLLFGFYDLIYTAFNVESKSELLNYLENHDGLY